LIEQPQSAIAIATASGANARGPRRKAPEDAGEPGIAIDATDSRASHIGSPPRRKMHRRKQQRGHKARVIAIKSADE
jgi:hypothetical protein